MWQDHGPGGSGHVLSILGDLDVAAAGQGGQEAPASEGRQVAQQESLEEAPRRCRDRGGHSVSVTRDPRPKLLAQPRSASTQPPPTTRQHPVRRWDDLHLLCPCCVRDANIHRLLVVSMYSHDSQDGWLVTSTLQMRKGSLGRKDVERSPKASRCSTGLEEPNGPGEQSVRARGRGCPGRGHTGTEKRPE